MYDNLEARQFGAAVPRRVEHVGLRARTLHETGNRLALTDCFNACNTANSAVVLAEMANRVPAPTPLVAKCYLRCEKSGRVISDGPGGDTDDRLLPRAPA